MIYNLLNKRFDRLVAIEHVFGTEKWKCMCDCGNTTIVQGTKLRIGAVRSCGCLNSEMSASRQRKHGLCGTREYIVWCRMLQRCNDISDKNYGGRGIRVCDRWVANPAAFYKDMGPRPSNKHTLERIDVNGDYCPENCRWATWSEQVNNTRRNRKITYRGETKTISEWSKLRGIPLSTLRFRLKNWDLESSFNSPRDHSHRTLKR